MPQKVVYYIDSADFGGAEQVLLHILAGLDRQRWCPVLIYHPASGNVLLAARAQDLGVEIVAVPPMHGASNTVCIMLRLFVLLRALRPAVFHANLHWTLAARVGLIAAMLARVPAIVATLHTWVPISHPRTIALQRLLCCGIGKYIAVSHNVSKLLQNTFHVPARKIEVVHNGIPVAQFDRLTSITLRHTLTGGRDWPIVLTPARLDAWKGHCYLLEAATQIPEALFVFAGDGPMRPTLEAQVQALHLNERVVFLDHRNDIPNLLASCDLVVLPSLLEGFPLVVLEAMAAGAPVIASAVGGVPEAITHNETGILVSRADSAALAHAISAALADPQSTARMAAAALLRSHRDFSAEAMVQKVTQIYEELLESKEGHHDRRYSIRGGTKPAG